ncbi:unnamed protein product [Rhizoctonia solani]|uniref:Uncharacterized protein n=1 Tax=Rhizoctonia solani TaxID=456999 RepID=A0A8H3E6T2_9AGAM|nr:unnamed protein product [Rhizoctonia solani]
MATTLRGFQHEIEQIHDRELAKQRAEGRLVLEKDKHKEKVPQASKPKDPVAPVAAEVSTDRLDNDEDDSHNKLQKMLTDPGEGQKITDYLALLLLRNRGEIIVRLGTHPPIQQIMEPGTELSVTDNHSRGDPITEEELDVAFKTLETTADSVGAKTMLLYRHAGTATHTPYASVLIRLPPPTVERTLEVRCAVVGNVDSGKSTTLGVLTRVAQTINIGRQCLEPHNHRQMPASRKKPRALKNINYGLLTDEAKKLQYFKSHLPTRLNAIKVGGRDVKPGDPVIMDIAYDDSRTSTSDDVCIAEILEIRSPEYDRNEQFVLIRWYYSGSSTYEPSSLYMLSD